MAHEKLKFPPNQTLIERVRWLAAQGTLHLPPDRPQDGRFYRDGIPEWMREGIAGLVLAGPVPAGFIARKAGKRGPDGERR